MLKHRIPTAIVLIICVIALIWWVPEKWFAEILAVLVVGVGGWEWSRLVGYQLFILRALYTFAALLGLFLLRWIPGVTVLTIGFAALLWTFIAIILFQKNKTPCGLQHPALRVVLGFLLLIPCWYGAIYIKENPNFGDNWFFSVLCIVWAVDVGAYFVGRSIGKHRLIERVSPKKTWEGFFGGLIFAMIVAVIASFFLPMSMGMRWYFYGLSLVTALFSVLGDLNISLLKRIVGVKDTGIIFPGHGGMLDRIDSVIAAFIVFALGMVLYVH